MRNVPPQNFLRINWPWSAGTNEIQWELGDFQTNLLNPLVAMLSSRQLTNQIDYVVLSMDIPYRVDDMSTGTTGNQNSTTSALYYGYQNDPHEISPGFDCEIAPGSTSLYYGSEGIFRQTPPINANSNSWLVTMIASSNDLAFAEATVLQGATSDGTFPGGDVLLCRGLGIGYDARFVSFDNAVFDTRINGICTLLRTNTDNIFTSSLLVGAQTGAYAFGISGSGLFSPGAMADNLNSFGGQFLEYTSGESTVLELFYAGATGSYGTVTEPCAYLEKFPNPENYLYQARGFSLAECYYMSVQNPYEGLVAGEPLAAPFAKPASGSWTGLASNAVLHATTNLSIQFNESDALHPVQQLDLFLDGNWIETVTNIAPAQSNVLDVTINGYSTNYTVPSNATIKTVTSNLVNTLNNSSYTNLTKAVAFLHGDRVELRSGAPYTVTGSNITLSAYSTNSSGTLTTFIRPSSSNFLDSIASGYNYYTNFGTPVSGSTMTLSVTETNGTMVTVTATNAATNSDLGVFTQQWMNLINSNATLMGSNGLTTQDFYEDSSSKTEFSLSAAGQGYGAAQIQVSLTASAGLTFGSAGNTTLTDNASDLVPRAHLYVTAGASNMSLNIPFVTTNYADGYHELDAVVYEGNHVHTQARATQDVIIQNTSLSATLNTLVGGSNSAIEGTLKFSVTPNTNAISLIQLYSTGGLIGAATNQPTLTNSIAASYLGIGLHPFYAIVTANSGAQYRTATTWINVIGPDSPFELQVRPSPLITLSWPSTGGRSYDILEYTNLTQPFQVLATVVATNTLAQWIQTNLTAPQLYYQVRVTP